MSKTYTKGKWALDMSSLTIRVKNFDESDLMADYRGNIICDLKPSLGIEDQDVQTGVIGRYEEGKGGRQHAYEEVKANAQHVCDLHNAWENLPEDLRGLNPAILLAGVVGIEREIVELREILKEWVMQKADFRFGVPTISANNKTERATIEKAIKILKLK